MYLLAFSIHGSTRVQRDKSVRDAQDINAFCLRVPSTKTNDGPCAGVLQPLLQFLLVILVCVPRVDRRQLAESTGHTDDSAPRIAHLCGGAEADDFAKRAIDQYVWHEILRNT